MELRIDRFDLASAIFNRGTTAPRHVTSSDRRTP
jgi:hypothetical protein